MESEILIQASRLSRIFPGAGENKTAVDNISFNLKRGQVLGFLGPNGAGKSTTMKMLTGNLAPSQGQITVAGMDLLDNPIEAKAMIGYLPDTPPLYKDLSIDEYLRFCGKINQIPGPRLKQAMDTAKERCGLSDSGKRIIGNLSKGYQQRVGIAQAIIHSPDIVILDEPTVGLDPIQIREIRRLIKELGETHSVMLSTHILPEIQMICSDVQIIHQGKLIFNANIEGLNRQMRTRCLKVCFEQNIDKNILTAIEGIDEVSGEGPCYTLHCNDKNTQSSPKPISQAVILLSVQHQWGLYEIHPERASLEEIFMSLTHKDPVEHHDDNFSPSKVKS